MKKRKTIQFQQLSNFSAYKAEVKVVIDRRLGRRRSKARFRHVTGSPDISSLLTINYKRQVSAPTAGSTTCAARSSHSTPPSSMLVFQSRQQHQENDVIPRTARLAKMKTQLPSQSRFSFESELTFAPKLNATSLKMVKERGNEFRSGVYPVRQKPKESEKLFTFKPQVSQTSAKIVDNLGTTFMARQELHLEKQKKLYEQSKMPFKGRLTPVAQHKAKNKDKNSAKEADNSQVAWATPAETPTKFDVESGNRENLPPVISRSTSIATSVLNPSKSPRPPPQQQTQSNLHLQKLQEDSFANSNANFSLRKNRTPLIRSRVPANTTITRHSHPPFDGDKNTEAENSTLHTSRSRTVLDTSPRPKVPRLAGLNVNRIRNAKLIAERAIKSKKVFSIHGPYPVVRECLRKRGWVEKQYRYLAPHVFKNKSKDSDDSGDSDDSDNDDGDDNKDDDSDDDFAGHQEENLEESDSIYGLMSRLVRNATPTFIWTVRRDSIDYKYLRRDTIVNHYAKNGSFTTKVGLCTNLRNLHWFQEADQDTFFPRCYKIGIEEEKSAFVDDFRMNAAIGFLKWVIACENGEILDVEKTEAEEVEKQDEMKNEDEVTEEKNDEVKENTEDTKDDNKNSEEAGNKTVQSGRKSKASKKRSEVIKSETLELAIKICDNYLNVRDHYDIDEGCNYKPIMTDDKWELFLQQYYQLVHDGATINNSSLFYEECKFLLDRLKNRCPQLHLDGYRNVWIVKPGAKSRGRGIMCVDKLEEITKLVSSQVIKKEGKWVVQKYIERPLLIYQTKFDIRQWFLVTDWNPLTIWFYKDSYLRFCTHKFTLENLEQKIHLANNSIQKYYDNEERSHHLPDDNMWSSEQFSTWLQKRGHGDVFQEVIYPGMKNAIISALQCTQDIIDPRKNSFELYGADFMVTDDLKPWLIEINSSPAMSASSTITEKMCYDVIEDTMKVVLDRKFDKNCDTGHFELIHKQQQVIVPPYIGINLHVEGQPIRKPGFVCKQKSISTVISPRIPELSPYTKTVPKATTATSLSTTSLSLTLKSPLKKIPDKSVSQSSQNDNQTTAIQAEEVKKKLSGTINSIDGAWGKACKGCGSSAGIKLDVASESSESYKCLRDSLVSPTPLQLPQHARYIASPEPIPRSNTFLKAYQADAIRVSNALQDQKQPAGFPPSRNVRRLVQTVKPTLKSSSDRMIRMIIKYDDDGIIKPQTCQMSIGTPR